MPANVYVNYNGYYTKWDTSTTNYKAWGSAAQWQTTAYYIKTMVQTTAATTNELTALTNSIRQLGQSINQWTYGWETNVGGFTVASIDENAEKKKALAKRKARALLKQFLTKEQWAEYIKDKRFHVLSQQGNLYQLRHGRSRNIRLIVDGKVAATYCIHPRESVPDEDTLLAQKFMLEANETLFTQIANVEWFATPFAEAA